MFTDIDDILFYVVGMIVPIIIFRIYSFKFILHRITGKHSNYILDAVFNEIVEFSEDSLLKVKISHASIGFNPFYNLKKNTICISQKWMVDYAKQHVNSIKEYPIFFHAVAHELGHKEYGDGMLNVYTNRKEKMISILREARADIFAKKKCGYSNVAAVHVMKDKVEHCRYRLNGFDGTHPTWEDRFLCVRDYDIYSLEVEKFLKSKYGKRLKLSDKELEHISLLSDEQ